MKILPILLLMALQQVNSDTQAVLQRWLDYTPSELRFTVLSVPEGEPNELASEPFAIALGVSHLKRGCGFAITDPSGVGMNVYFNRFAWEIRDNKEIVLSRIWLCVNLSKYQELTPVDNWVYFTDENNKEYVIIFNHIKWVRVNMSMYAEAARPHKK